MGGGDTRYGECPEDLWNAADESENLLDAASNP